MASPDPFAGGNRSIERDGYGRPKVMLPDGSKRKAYTRCTTYVKCLEDVYRLGLWDQRNVAIGLSARKDLLTSVAAHYDDKAALNKLCEQAAEAGKATAASTTGTAIHRFCERLDSGEKIPSIPEDVKPDLDAYQAAMRPFKVLQVEAFLVEDERQIGGTTDRILEYSGPPHPLLDAGGRYIGDIKTGASLEWGIAKMAMQLAVYAHSKLYDPETHRRSPHGCSTTKGIIIWLPAGKAKCEIHVIDIAAGWRGVELAGRVRAWRSKDKPATFLRWFDPTATVEGSQEAQPSAQPQPGPGELVTAESGLMDAISSAESEEALTSLWRQNKDVWHDGHSAAAAERKKALTDLWRDNKDLWTPAMDLLQDIANAGSEQALTDLWRDNKDLWTPAMSEAAAFRKRTLQERAGKAYARGVTGDRDSEGQAARDHKTLLDTIAGCPDLVSLTALWRDHKELWDDELTAAAAQRRSELQQPTKAAS